MELYHFRLTDPSGNIDMLRHNVLTYLRANAIVYLSVYELSKQGVPHTHSIVGFLKTKSTFFQAFHKHFKNRFSGNKCYSCETLRKDASNNYIYLCKGTRDAPPDVLFKTIDVDTNELWKKYWEDKPIEKDYAVIHADKPKKTKALTWSEELTISIRKEWPARTWEYNPSDISDLWDLVLQHLGKGSKKLNGRIISDLVMGQLNALNPDCYHLHKSMKHIAFPDLFNN